MRASTFISKTSCLLFLQLLWFLPVSSFGAEYEDIDSPLNKKEITNQPEDEDYRDTPYTQYGEFNEEEDEEEATRFFQYGRFFGLGLGGGFQGVTGNRNRVWRGGWPLFELKMQVWLNFDLAIQAGFFLVTHQFDTPDAGQEGTITQVAYNRVFAEMKYYFDTTNLAAPISFAGPNLIFGAGSYNKTETNANGTSTDKDSSFGVSAGFGFEFVMSHKKSYFCIETKAHFPTFEDRFTSRFQDTSGSGEAGIQDLTGIFYTITGGFLFTW
jgi:hypothetical protein